MYYYTKPAVEEVAAICACYNLDSRFTEYLTKTFIKEVIRNKPSYQSLVVMTSEKVSDDDQRFSDQVTTVSWQEAPQSLRYAFMNGEPVVGIGKIPAFRKLMQTTLRGMRAVLRLNPTLTTFAGYRVDQLLLRADQAKDRAEKKRRERMAHLGLTVLDHDPKTDRTTYVVHSLYALRVVAWGLLNCLRWERNVANEKHLLSSGYVAVREKGKWYGLARLAHPRLLEGLQMLPPGAYVRSEEYLLFENGQPTMVDRARVDAVIHSEAQTIFEVYKALTAKLKKIDAEKLQRSRKAHYPELTEYRVSALNLRGDGTTARTENMQAGLENVRNQFLYGGGTVTGRMTPFGSMRRTTFDEFQSLFRPRPTRDRQIRFITMEDDRFFGRVTRGWDTAPPLRRWIAFDSVPVFDEAHMKDGQEAPTVEVIRGRRPDLDLMRRTINRQRATAVRSSSLLAKLTRNL